MHVILQVHVGYKNPKTYILTPQRKKLGKAVARRSHKQVATECMKNESSFWHAVRIVGNRVNEEIRAISSSQNALVYQSKNSLNGFKWDKHLKIFLTSAPVLLCLLKSATKTRGIRSNRSAVIGMSIALLLKHRNPKINLIQRMISFILYAGQCSKQVSSILAYHAHLCHRTFICRHFSGYRN